MPWLATSRAPPWLMLGGIPPSITVWGVIVIRGKCLVYSKYAGFIVINPCTAEPGYRQNHVNFILALNASLLLCVEPCSVTIVFDVKYAIPDSRSMGPTWGLHGADRTQVGPMWATWTLLSGYIHLKLQPHSFDNFILILLYTLQKV